VLEMASAKFSLSTDYPLMLVDPSNNPTHGGFGDMNITTKLVFAENANWQLTYMMRTFMPTGSPGKGTGTGHVSMDHGLLFRYRVNCKLYWHNEFAFQFPLGGDPTWQGDLVTYATGLSYVLMETDLVAWMPTLELVGNSVLGGMQSISDFGLTQKIDSLTMVSIMPGMRVAMDKESVLGMLELGVSSGFSPTTERMFTSMIRFDARWSF
jgi:hypothetical protein